MNWTALAVVTGLSTLFMIIQYVANQRQYDFSLDPPNVRPVSRPPPVEATALDDQPPAAPSSPHSDRHRGIGFSFDARSDDDCSSYLLNKPRPQAAADSSSDLDSGSPGAEQRNAGTEYPGRRQPTSTTQPSMTNYNPLAGARSRNSDQSIGCGDGAQTLDSIRQRTHRSSSSPCRSFEETAAGSRSFEYRETQSPVTDTHSLNPSETGRGSLSDAIEIITTPSCDRNFASEVTVCENNEDGERRGSQRRRRQGFCEQAGLTMSRALDYIIRFLNIILVLLLIADWIIGFRRNDDVGGDDEDRDGGTWGSRSSRNPCSYWRNFFSLLGYDSPDCEPVWMSCQKP